MSPLNASTSKDFCFPQYSWSRGATVQHAISSWAIVSGVATATWKWLDSMSRRAANGEKFRARVLTLAPSLLRGKGFDLAMRKENSDSVFGQDSVIGDEDDSTESIMQARPRGMGSVHHNP